MIAATEANLKNIEIGTRIEKLVPEVGWWLNNT